MRDDDGRPPDDADASLVQPLSALRRSHEQSCRLGQERGPWMHHAARSVVYGDRRLRHPLMALTTSQDLGPARHALEQRIVGGFAALGPPGASLVPKARGPVDPGSEKA